MLVDIGTDGMVVIEDCGPARCVTRVMEPATGVGIEVPTAGFDTAIGSIDGRAVIVGMQPLETGGAIVVASDPRTGARRELYRAPPGSWLAIQGGRHLMPHIDGAIMVVESAEDGKAMEQRYLLLPLGGGDAVEFPAPPIRPLGPVGLNG